MCVGVLLAQAELENRCPPNVGVTGPTCHEGNTHILTHDFTHRHHMEIFKSQYYPVELTDWWLDDWITHIYGVDHTSRVLDVVVKHHTGMYGFVCLADSVQLTAEWIWNCLTRK